MIMKFSSNAPIIHVSANTSPNIPIQAVLTISNKHDFSINKYNANASPSTQTYSEPSQPGIGQQGQLPLSMDSLLGKKTDLTYVPVTVLRCSSSSIKHGFAPSTAGRQLR